MFDDCFRAMEATQVKQEGDYIQDGLVYCGKCGTPKQCYVPLNGRKYKMPCLCQCKSKQLATENDIEKEQRRIDKIAKLRENGITDEEYREWTFENSTEPLHFAKNYVANWQRMYKDNIGLMLLGNKGTGKTYVAACIANALIDKGVPVYMVNAVRLSNKLFNFYDKDRDSLIHTIESVKLLILDDFGAERGTETTQEQIYNIIETRSRAGKPLIITSNLTRADFKNEDLRFSRTYDRLIKMCHPVEMKGESKRKQIANERYKEIKRVLEG